MLTCWSEAHRPADTLDIKSVYSAGFTEGHSGNKLLTVPERIITAGTQILTAHFKDDLLLLKTRVSLTFKYFIYFGNMT